MGKVKRFPDLFGVWIAFLPAVFFFAGGVFGCLFGGFAQGESAVQAERYLSDYLALAESGVCSDSSGQVFRILWMHGRWILLCLLLGAGSLGVIGLPILFAVRGFLLAFSVSCFIRFLGALGAVGALCLLGLPALLWLPGFFLCGSVGLWMGAQRFARRFGGASVCPIPVAALRRAAAAAAFSLMLCILLERFLLPVMLTWAVRLSG